MLDVHLVGRFDFQQPVPNRQVLETDLEMDQDFEQRGGRTLGAIHNAPAARVPAPRRPQRVITREGEMVADPPKKHLRGHALVDAVQQLLDKAGAGFGDQKLQRTATIKLPLLRTEPVPPAFAVSEDLFSKRGNTGKPYGSIRFVPAQSLMAGATMRQRAPGYDERVDLVVGQTRLAEPIDHCGGEAILD
jgi:hypothetical protein